MPTDPSIKCPKLYKALKRDGYSKSDAAAISNGLWRKGKCTGGRKEEVISAMPTATKEHTGIMVAFFLPLVVAQGIAALYREQFDYDAMVTPANELHMTLMYLGDTNTTEYDAGQLSEWLWEWAQGQQPIRGVLNGIGKFNSVSPEGVPVYLSYDSPELPAFRQSLVEFFQGKGLNLEFNHGFTPHITLAYTPNYKDGWLIDVPQQEIVFDEITLAFGGNQSVVPLGRSNFTVTKDAKGEYRWTLISSSAYVDRDGEIVTEEALERAVEKMKATGEYGNLLWWHTPIVLGKADFAMVHAHQLLESGTFASKDIAQKVEAAAAGLGASIGFGHTPDQPRNKEYHDIAIKERSLLPRGKESNLFTRLRVAGGSRMKELTAEKRAGLVALLGEDEANAHIAVMERTKKEADDAGVTRKEAAPPKGWFQRFKEALAAIPEPEEDEGDDVDLEELAEDIEAEAAALAEEKAKKADKAEDTDPDDMPMTRREVKAMIAAWEKDAKKEAETVATKAEVAAVKEVQTTTTAVITELTNTVKELQEQLKEVRGEQPRVFGALFGGSRPSAESSTKTGEVRDVAKEQGEYKTPVHAAVAALDKQG